MYEFISYNVESKDVLFAFGKPKMNEKSIVIMIILIFVSLFFLSSYLIKKQLEIIVKNE